LKSSTEGWKENLEIFLNLLKYSEILDCLVFEPQTFVLPDSESLKRYNEYMDKAERLSPGEQFELSSAEGSVQNFQRLTNILAHRQ